jgi:hypothetical protein
VTVGAGAVAVVAAVAAPGVQLQITSFCASVDLAASRSGLAVWICPNGTGSGEVVDLPVDRLETISPGQREVGPSTTDVDAIPADIQLGPLHRALTALERTGFDRSPAQLAEHLAATGSVGLDPALYLDAMLRRWPLAADHPIPRSRVGALAVVNFGMAAADLEGNTGALEAIQSRLPGLTQPEPGEWVTLPDGTVLPDAPQDEDDRDLSLRGLFDIDPRLARLSVDEVVLGVWSLTPFPADITPGLSDGAPPGEVQSLRTNQQRFDQLSSGLAEPVWDEDLRLVYPLNTLQTFADALLSRFGVDPGFDPTGTETVTLNAIVAVIRASLEAEAPLDGSFRAVLVPWPAEVGLVLITPVLLALVWAWLGFAAALRRELARFPRVPPPQFHLVVPAPDREAPALALAARRLAPQLRHTLPRETASLDVEATLARTLKQGGYFSPVLRTRRDVASHVVLIHRRTMAEHEPRRIAALLGQLQAAGVLMVLYEYAADPSRVRPFGQPGAPVRDLVSLLQEFPNARLIVVTTGEEFVGSGAYGASANSIRAICSWQHRAVVTPVPIAAWGMREWALSVRLGAPLGRAGADGVPDLAEIFPSDPQSPRRGPAAAPLVAEPGAAAGWLRRMRERLLHGDRAVPLPSILVMGEAEAAVPRGSAPDRIEAQVASLRRWLGPKGFLWLQACASYPVLRYPLTRWLGEQLFGPAASPTTLAQLTQLPWFTVGRMPSALVRRLRQDVSATDAARIEDIFADFFELHAVEGPSPAQDAGHRYLGDQITFEPDALSTDIPGARQLPAKFAADPEAETARLRRVRLAVMADRVAVVVATALLSAALWAVWPERGALPLPPGAWVPVAALLLLWVVAGTIALLGVAALRRARRALNVSFGLSREGDTA